MGSSCSRYSENGYCIDHLVMPTEDKDENVNQTGVIDVDTNVPITISGSTLLLLILALLLIFVIIYYCYRQYRLGGNSTERRLRRFNRDLNAQHQIGMMQNHIARVRDQYSVAMPSIASFPAVPATALPALPAPPTTTVTHSAPNRSGLRPASPPSVLVP